MRAFIIFLLLLAGCSSQPTLFTPQEVSIPIPVRCKITFPEKPTSISEDKPVEGVYNRGLRILKESVDYRLYSRKLEALLMACADRE